MKAIRSDQGCDVLVVDMLVIWLMSYPIFYILQHDLCMTDLSQLVAKGCILLEMHVMLQAAPRQRGLLQVAHNIQTLQC